MNKPTYSILIAVILVIAAALSRVILYPHNFSPIIGMAIFAGAVIKDKRLSFLLPLLAMFLSDVLFEVFKIAPGFWGWGQLVNYGILALITIFGFTIKKVNTIKVFGYSITSSLIFFFLSNSSVFVFDVYSTSSTYTLNIAGYFNCLMAGIPFLKTGVIADLAYSFILFGTYYLIQNYAFKKMVA